MEELDTFVDTTIANRRPIPVSSTREDQFVDYPYWATRELLMNAICHRDYTSNGPIQFYQFDDRIEIMNHGGLYGRANEQNFPKVNDYRNIVVAEAMKVLGVVNRHSRGVLRVQKEMNRKAKYSWLADNLGVSEASIKRAIMDLKELGYINKDHSKVNGEWQLLK